MSVMTIGTRTASAGLCAFLLLTTVCVAQRDSKLTPLSTLEKSCVMAHLDVETTGLGYRSLEHGDLGEQLGVEGKPRVPLEHTGLGCAEYNVRVYRALLNRRRNAD